VHAIRSNIESNSIRSLSLIQAVEVKSGTAVAEFGSLPQRGNPYAASPTILALSKQLRLIGL
jgi:hypothetical protein